MGKIGLIIKREYLTRVRKRSFIIMTILGPLLFAGMMAGAVLIGMSDEDEHEVIIADYNGVITTYNDSGGLRSRFPRRFQDDDQVRFHFMKESLDLETFRNSHYTIMVELDDQSLNDGRTNFYFKKLPSSKVRSKIANELQSSLEEFRVRDSLKMSYEDYKRIKMSVSLNPIDIDKLDETDLTQERAIVGFIFATIIWMFIFMYGVQVMRGVIEEKTNRIVEILVSSVKPFQLMMGKITGIGLVGLTQFLLWVVLSGIIYSVAQTVLLSGVASPSAVLDTANQANAGLDANGSLIALAESPIMQVILSINWPFMISMFIIYFIGGYLLYASLFAAIGAAVDSETDTQQFMLPITLPLVFGLFISEFLMMNPEGPMGTIFSIIPLTAPVVVMLKAAMFTGDGTWVFVLSILVLILTFLGTTWLAGRIYRTGILMYGKKVSYKEMWKWLFFK